MDLSYLIKYYFYISLAHIFYHLGDIVSRPLNWNWANNESKTTEFLVHINYSLYNYLMLKSCNFNDEVGGDVWVDYKYDDTNDG